MQFKINWDLVSKSTAFRYLQVWVLNPAIQKHFMFIRQLPRYVSFSQNSAITNKSSESERRKAATVKKSGIVLGLFVFYSKKRH